MSTGLGHINIEIKKRVGKSLLRKGELKDYYVDLIVNRKLRGNKLIAELLSIMDVTSEDECLRYYRLRNGNQFGATYSIEDDIVEKAFGAEYDGNPELHWGDIKNLDVNLYQPTPVALTLGMVLDLGITKDDVFYDLGCGKGVVANLVALTTKAKIKGVELYPIYYDFAVKTAKTIGIKNVEFRNEDVCKTDFSDGTIFYLFNPFVGKILSNVLRRIYKNSRTKTIKIATLSETSAILSREHRKWTKCISGYPGNMYSMNIYETY